MPASPPESVWRFPPASDADENGILAVGADLEPGTVLAAYRAGIFPMPIEPGGPIAWWSPDPRGIIPVDSLTISRSLRRSCRRYEVTVDRAFTSVISACATESRPHGWIDSQIIDAYVNLHELGWAHSVETWDDGELVGGLYGIGMGRFFAGESMFHRSVDASKVALVGLVALLRKLGIVLLDVQWTTPHLESLGARPIPRSHYLRLLADACAEPYPWPPNAAQDWTSTLIPAHGQPMERR